MRAASRAPPGGRFTGGVCRAGVTLAGLLSATPGAAAEWVVKPVLSESRWEERRADGQLLVAEQGQLAGVQLDVHAVVEPVDTRFQLLALQGNRAYHGVTQRGAVAHSSSLSREWLASAGLRLPLLGPWGAIVSVQMGGRARHLKSTATASGYPERWHWLTGMTGLGGMWPLGGGALALEAQWGHTPWRTESVRLPGRDPARLTPGSGLESRLALRWSRLLDVPRDTPDIPRWGVDAELGWSRLRWGASPAVPLRRESVVVGLIAQPATTWETFSIGLGLSGRW